LFKSIDWCIQGTIHLHAFSYHIWPDNTYEMMTLYKDTRKSVLNERNCETYAKIAHFFKLMFTCFENHVFIIRKTICICSFVWYVFHAFMQTVYQVEGNTSFHLLDCLHKCMENIPQKSACTNGLPDDEHMMLETCRRHEEFN
jgi:hypothetical protein